MLSRHGGAYASALILLCLVAVGSLLQGLDVSANAGSSTLVQTTATMRTTTRTVEPNLGGWVNGGGVGEVKRAVWGARVTVAQGNRTMAAATTDRDGFWAVYVPSGVYAVTIAADGYVTFTGPVEVGRLGEGGIFMTVILQPLEGHTTTTSTTSSTPNNSGPGQGVLNIWAGAVLIVLLLGAVAVAKRGRRKAAKKKGKGNRLFRACAYDMCFRFLNLESNLARTTSGIMT